MVEHRTISTTGGGTALTTTAALITVPQVAGSGEFALTARDFTNAGVVAQYTLNPRLTVLFTNDSLVTFTDDSVHAQDGLSTTDFELDAMLLAPTGRFYLGSPVPFRGFAVDMDASEVNAVTSVLTMFYWNGSAWTDTSDTDGSASGGATFAQDGNVTFTVPATWAAATLFDIGDADATTWKPDRSKFNILNRALYWLRGEVSATLSAATSVNQLRALNASTNYAEIEAGQTVQQTVQTDYMGTASIEALMDAGNGNMVANLAARDFV